MEREFSTISELKNIREQKSRLSERESELASPQLSDLNLIPEIYKWFCEINNAGLFAKRNESSHQRKKFIFIILFLYAPSVLAGGRMPIGLRDIIAEACGVTDLSFISHNVDTVVFMFQNYKDFRKDIDYLYTEILKRLKS